MTPAPWWVRQRCFATVRQSSSSRPRELRLMVWTDAAMRSLSGNPSSTIFAPTQRRIATSGRGPMNAESSFRTFGDFYPFYLGEHANRTCRRLHFIGTSTAVALILAAGVTQTWWLVAVAFLQGYAFAWVGHFFF